MKILATKKQQKNDAIKANYDLAEALEAQSRDFTAEEKKTFDANRALIKKLDAEIEGLEELAAHKAEGDKIEEPKTLVRGEKSRIEVKENFKEDPKKGFKSSNEFISAVMKHGGAHPKASKDPRLQFLAAVGSDEQSVGDNTAGGFLVPEGFSPNVLQIGSEADPTIGVMSVPMGSPIVKIPARTDKNHSTSVSGGLTVSRKSETVAGGTSKMSFEQVVLEAFTLFGGSYVTEELLSDSPQSFAAILAAGFQDQFGYHMINERLNGSGVGEHLGVMNAPCLVSVAKEAGQAADTIVYKNVLNMRARCWGYANAVWIANHNCFPQLAQMSLAVGTGGGPVYMPSAQVDRPDILLGRPIFYSEYAKTLGDQGDLVLANWSQYLEGNYQPLQSAESIHVRFLNNERTFKFWLRNAGQPWWKSALTPKNGSTLSPFVTLDARA